MRLLFAIFLMTLLPISSHAEGPRVGEQFGDWVFDCRALSADSVQCQLVQRLIEKNSRQQIAQLSISKFGAKRELTLAVVLPLGIHLPSGVAVAVDQGKPVSMVVHTCAKVGCEAIVAIDDTLRQAFEKGNKLVVQFRPNATSEVLGLVGSLKGIKKGIQSLK